MDEIYAHLSGNPAWKVKRPRALQLAPNPALRQHSGLTYQETKQPKQCGILAFLHYPCH